MENYDPDSVPFAPVFTPTLAEFKDFWGYLEKCEQKVGRAGIYKVVAPNGWVPRKSGYEDLPFMVRKPIEQNVHGEKGVYDLVYFMKDSKPLDKFKKQAISQDRLSEGKSVNEIEQLFWKTLKHSAPTYGADVLGSMFDKGIPWNLTEIHSLLNEGLLGQIISGVNSPYVYIGAWKTMFGWHKEDLDLYSINYLHHGKPKFWYGVDLDCNTTFENFVQSKFPDSFNECPEFIRHKTTLIHPGILQQKGIRMRKMLHNPGEFMISRAAAYHSGFNHGYNIAEAVNFALSPWLEHMDKVASCNCLKDSVRFDMLHFLTNVQNNLKKGGKTKRFISERLQKRIADKLSHQEKKIKKNLKNLERLALEESKELDHWIRCDNCHIWRKVRKESDMKKWENIKFTCPMAKGQCKVKQQKSISSKPIKKKPVKGLKKRKA